MADTTSHLDNHQLNWHHPVMLAWVKRTLRLVLGKAKDRPWEDDEDRWFHSIR